MPPQKHNPKSRTEKIVVQKLKDEVLVYDLKTNQALCLNETSALIWQACDGNRSVNKIRDFVSQKLNSPIEDELILLALKQLKEGNLIENTETIDESLKGVSRRDLISKIGFSLAIALPIVSSVVAPSVVDAQSGCLQLDADCDVANDMCCPGLTCQNRFGPTFFFCRP